MYEVLIIGGGPVGLFAAFEAGMLGMRSCIIDSLPKLGGQCIELYPKKPIYDIPAHPFITAEDLINNLKQQIAPFDPKIYCNSKVISIDKVNNTFIAQTECGKSISARVVIIAAGCGAFTPNKPNLHSIGEFEKSGCILYSVVEIENFRNKDVVIAGGGDSAVDWALALSDIANCIYVVHRRSKFRALQANVDQMHKKASNNFKILTPYQLHSLIGRNGVLTHISIKQFPEGEEENIEVKADYLLSFFGLKMSLGPVLDWNLNIENNHIVVDQTNMQTNIEGVFAIGDIAKYNGKLKLILTGFAEAALAANSAYKLIYPEKPLHFEYSTNKGIQAL
ncbi:MAG: NAD(P)/FAD-dependent oxidoreductase [Proteobacteria bacterium]|nr:NAD(P)/FAD-dependent oxidoreductase [Pseudomonadota bacterium]